MMERLCEDILAEILIRLPAKSVFICKSLSKRYNRILSDPRFALNHSLRSTPSEVFGLFSFIDLDFSKVLNFPVPSQQRNKNYSNNYMIKLASCNGLILFALNEHKFCIFNPTTEEFRILPESKSDSILFGYNLNFGNLGLAYDPIRFDSIDYKVVCVYRDQVLLTGKEVYGFKVFNFSTNSWRKCEQRVICERGEFFGQISQAVYLDGILHWCRISGDIIAFDVEKEAASIILLPRRLEEEWSRHENDIYSWFGAANGLLYLVYVRRGEIVMWVLHDYQRRKWGCVNNKIRGLPRGAYPIFFDGERLVLEKVSEERQIFMYNMKLENWKKVGKLPNDVDHPYNIYIPFIPTLVPIQGTIGAVHNVTTTTTYKNKGRKRSGESIAPPYRLRSRDKQERFASQFVQLI